MRASLNKLWFIDFYQGVILFLLILVFWNICCFLGMINTIYLGIMTRHPGTMDSLTTDSMRIYGNLRWNGAEMITGLDPLDTKNNYISFVFNEIYCLIFAVNLILSTKNYKICQE